MSDEINYLCTKCGLPCDRWESAIPSPTASRPATVTGSVETHEGHSLCCSAVVRVFSEKRQVRAA